MNIIIIRHFKTKKDNNNQEQIIYDNIYEIAQKYINFIVKILSKKSNINKIIMLMSPQDRTIITSLIISTLIKNEIIKNNITGISIIEPEIDKILDRDPYKIKKKKISNNIYEKITSFDQNTLYIYVSHSSVIYNIYKNIVEYATQLKLKKFSEKITSYSLSYVIKNKDNYIYEFNKDILNY